MSSLKVGYLFVFLVMLFSPFPPFYTPNSHADRTEYVVPGPDAYANGTLWKNAASTLYWDAETTGTKTVSLGRGEYRFIGGNDAMHYPGIRHIATDSTPTFSLDNSEDDITTGVIVYGGICPREDTYFKNINFRLRLGQIDSVVTMLYSNVYLEDCAMIGNSTDISWKNMGISNGAGQAIPGTAVLTVRRCKFINVEDGIHTFSNVLAEDCRIQAKRAAYCSADALTFKGDNTIDLYKGAPGTRTFLELDDPASPGGTSDGDKASTETLLSEYWMYIELLGQDGQPVTSLGDAFEYFRDWRSSGGSASINGITIKNEYKEYNPFPSDVHIYLDTGEPRTAIKIWEGYE